jgi:hypothetical protein
MQNVGTEKKNLKKNFINNIQACHVSNIKEREIKALGRGHVMLVHMLSKTKVYVLLLQMF